jgi:hypothetical protein
MPPLFEDLQDLPLKVSRWHLLLDEAATVDGVFTILRDYIDSLSTAELALLPPHCRPGRLRDDNDISYWTFVLAQHKCREEDAEQREVHQAVLNHFLHASMRISEIRKNRIRAHEGDGSIPPNTCPI